MKVSDQTSYKKYYLAKMLGLFMVLKQAYVGFCVPEECTADDIKTVVKEIVGEKNYVALVVTNTHEYAKEKLQWDIGTYAWFGVILLTATIATVATYKNQKEVNAKKTQKEKLKELGETHTVNERRKEVTQEQKDEKTHPSLWVQWDLIVNLRSLIYPMRINSSVQVFELMRILAFFWVVWGHEFAYRMPSSSNYIAPHFFDYTATSWGFTFIETGFYAVDIFLFIGGYVSILATSKYVNSFQKAKVSKWPAIYLFNIVKRYIRIMPAYAVMMLYYWKVNPALVSGPMSSDIFLCNSKNFW